LVAGTPTKRTAVNTILLTASQCEQVCAILRGFDYEAANETTAAKRMPLIAQAAEHVLQQKDGNGYMNNLRSRGEHHAEAEVGIGE
jgi:hypothetical protein